MRLCCPEPIMKAKRPKWARTRTGKRTMALANAMSKAVSVDLVKGIKKFKSRIDPEKIYQAWLSGDYNAAMKDVRWEELAFDTEPSYKHLDLSSKNATSIALSALPPPIQENLRYDTKAPRLQNFINRRTGELITNLQTDSQKVVQSAIARSFNEALNPRQVSGLIRDSVGLNERQSTALFNFRRGLEESGSSDKHIQKLTDAYADRLLDSRAMTIARTETAFASNYGQLYVWQEASNQGLLSADAQKVWEVDGDPCPICEDMDGEAVGLAESWTLSTGDSVDIPNESHPNCMCVMTLDFGDSAGQHEDNTPEEQTE